MSQLNTDYLSRCIATLNRAANQLRQYPPDDIEYDIYRAACVKEFEIVLEQSGKLLRKCLRPYLASHKQADMLNFKDVFRVAAKHGLMTLEEAERWLAYRDNRNNTAHDYGEGFANATLALLPQFLEDAKRLQDLIGRQP